MRPSATRPQRLVAAVIGALALLEAVWRLRRRDGLRQLSPPPGRWPLPPPDRLAWAVDGWLRRLRHPRPCLPRSAALSLLLRRSGRPVVLHCGVHRGEAGGLLRGHAWLSLHGRPYLEPIEPALSGFVETLRLPPA